MRRNSLVFTGPGKAEIIEDIVPNLKPEQVLVNSILSGISAGTELLVFRGQVPEEMRVDDSIGSLSGSFHYPLKYGYANIGEIVDIGGKIAHEWLGRKVFSFHPHESAYPAQLDEIFPIPEGMSVEDAVFLPNMETAVNFVMDGRPMIGDRVIVLGLGVVGLLTTSLLARFPLNQVLAFDLQRTRREAIAAEGNVVCFDPSENEQIEHAKKLLGARGADLSFEVSGSPSGLNLALQLTGFAGKIVLGSWYGKKKVDLDLGGQFHRSRIQLISSQVSTIAPELLGRWDKSRRINEAWRMINEIKPSKWVTHRIPFGQSPQTYHWLSTQPEDAIQVVLTYP